MTEGAAAGVPRSEVACVEDITWLSCVDGSRGLASHWSEPVGYGPSVAEVADAWQAHLDTAHPDAMRLAQAQAWADALIAGASLRALGRAAGVTGEWVRQVVRDAGLMGSVYAAREQARQAQVAAREADRAARLAARRMSVQDRASHRHWTDDEIVAALRTWLERGGSGKSTDWVAAGMLPSAALVVSRMGWANALRAAGGTPGWVAVRPRKDKVSRDVCLDAVVRFLTDPGETLGGAHPYDRWTARQRDVLPTQQTVRKRFGTWAAAKRAALAVIAAQDSGGSGVTG